MISAATAGAPIGTSGSANAVPGPGHTEPERRSSTIGEARSSSVGGPRGSSHVGVFPNWQDYAIPQRRLETGCIPTGYEMILRAAHARGIDFATFQDDFDLDKDWAPGDTYRNNFESVARAVNLKYPSVSFRIAAFACGDGSQKLRFVEEQLAAGRPLLISLTRGSLGGWHIMPVVDLDQYRLKLLQVVSPDGVPQILEIDKQRFVWIHDNWPGGDDVAYLESF